MRLHSAVTSARAHGPRDHQEDRVICEPFVTKTNGSGYLIGVLDGHGGGEVSTFCAHKIPEIFSPHADDATAELIRIVQSLADQTEMFESGSTLSLVHIDEHEKIATTAILGDSPIVVIDKYGSTHIQLGHNISTNALERAAIEQRGGVCRDKYVYNAPGNDYGMSTYHGLQLTRALGDCDLRFILDRRPEINQFPLGTRSKIIVASDGILASEDAIRQQHDLLAMATELQGADEMLQHRIKQKLDDNTSIVVWRARSLWERFLGS